METEKEKDKFDIYQEIVGKKPCTICGKYIHNSGYANHTKACTEREGDWETKKTYYETISQDKIYDCEFCGRSFEHNYRARNAHQMKCAKNPKREEVIEKIRETCTGQKTPINTKRKISQSMKEYRKLVDDPNNKIVDKTTIKDVEELDTFIDLIFKEDI